MAERGEHLIRLRRADSAAKAARVLAALEAMVSTGEPPGVSLLARRAGVSRRFVYDHPDLRAEITRRAARIADQQAGAVTASARTTTASLRADLENAKARNHRLEVELTALRRRLGQLMGREVFDEISAETTPGTVSRISEIEQALFNAEDALVRRSEELESARQINRELMARLNRAT
jgi:regulator of replication initiation timing